MKLTLAYRAVLVSLVASSLPGYQLVSARSLLELTSRSLTTNTCSQLVDAAGGSGNLLSLKLTRGDNEATTVQDSSTTYHEHGAFAATAEWYSDVCGDYSISCTHHECLMGLYFVPCKDGDAEKLGQSKFMDAPEVDCVLEPSSRLVLIVVALEEQGTAEWNYGRGN